MESEFAKKVYKITKTIPKGKVTTYGILAQALGKSSGSSQAVGRILAANTYSDVPCHRVVDRNGQISGYFGSTAGDAIDKRIKKMESEGLIIENGKIVELDSVIFKP